MAIIGEPIEFSDDERTQQILRDLAKFEREKDAANVKRAREFESKFHETFCLLPRRSTSGKWIWFDAAFIRYKAVKRNYLDVTHDGSLVVTDPVAHYLAYQYDRGAPLEILTRAEMELR